MKPVIQYQDFEKIDLRVGKVISAVVPEWSEKAIEFKVDFGEEVGTRTILAGVKPWFSPTEFMGKSVSQGMMLMAVEDEEPILIEVNKSVKAGTVVR